MTAVPGKVEQAYGRLPAGWRLEKLKFFADVRNSNVDKTIADGEEPVRLCNYTDVYYNDRITPDLEFMQGSATQAEIEKFQLKRHQVIVTKDSESWDDIGIPALVAEDMPGVVCGYHLSVFEPNGVDLDGGYLAWLCRSEPLNDQFKLGANGVTRFGLGQHPMKNALVALPPLETQQQIARFLDEKTARIDGLIEKKRALLDRLAEKRQALITHAVTKGLNPTAPMKPSGIDWLGDIPAHWEVKRLDRLTIPTRPIRYGIVLPGPDFPDGVPIIKGGDVNPAKLRADLLNRTDPEIDAAHDRSRILAGDIVYSIRGSFGDVEIVPAELDGCNLTQDAARISAISEINRDWLLYVLKSDAVRKQLDAGAIGATIKGINIHDLRRTLVPFPPSPEQDELASWLSAQIAVSDGTLTKCATSVDKLTEYRAALITAAVTGKLKIAEAENVMVLDHKRRSAPDAFKRAVFAARIADRMCDQPTFGRVKFQKLLHLGEAHLGIHEISGNYHRHAAGPHDARMLKSVESQLAKQGWIITESRQGGKGTLYQRGNKVDNYPQYFERYWGERAADIDAFLELLSPMSTQQAEIVSTAYAAWNDLLLEGKNGSDDAILQLIATEWHEAKTKIPEDRWRAALGWMREKGLVPTGTGSHTKRSGA